MAYKNMCYIHNRTIPPNGECPMCHAILQQRANLRSYIHEDSVEDNIPDQIDDHVEL